MEIVWTANAFEDYLEAIEYLENHWTEKEIYKFQNAINQLIAVIKTYPLAFKKSKRIGLQKCVINYQKSLIYSVENNLIAIIAIIDNRSGHSY